MPTVGHLILLVSGGLPTVLPGDVRIPVHSFDARWVPYRCGHPKMSTISIDLIESDGS